MPVPLKIADVRGRVAFAILTVRADEFEAVLERLPESERRSVHGGRQRYEYLEIAAEDGPRGVAVTRQLDQGQSAAQAAASNIFEDLDPHWLVLVGIAGGIPDHEFSLGDVLLASRVHDFSVSAIVEGGEVTYQQRGGPPHPDVKPLLEALPAWRNRLARWSEEATIGRPRPSVSVKPKLLYGPPEYQEQVRAALLHHFPPGPPRPPRFHIGPVASSNELVKQSLRLAQWQESARHLTHIEMEAGGAHEAAHATQRPLLCVRGISDIVGFKRSHEWTAYACHAAASFVMELLKSSAIDVPPPREASRPVAPRDPPPPEPAEDSEVTPPPRAMPALPGPVGHCFGRDDEIAKVVDVLLAEASPPLPIIGPPGIGKSTVAGEALRGVKVAKRFGPRRYFVRCDAATSAERVLAAIALTVGVPPGPHLRARLFDELARAPAAMVLDNFETPWRADEAPCEELLGALSGLGGLALAVAIRWRSLPAGVKWLPAVDLARLQRDESRRQFLAVAGEQFAADPDLEYLLDQVDGLPLATQHLASAARDQPDLAELRVRWDRRKTDLLPPLANALESSIDRLDDDGKRFLAALAWLPAGLAHEDLRALEEPWWLEAAASVRRAALAFDEKKRLRLLAPIREHLLQRHPAGDSTLAVLERHYAELTGKLGEQLGYEGGEVAARRLSAETENIEAIVAWGLETGQPVQCIEAAIAYGKFARFTGVGSPRVLEHAEGISAKKGLDSHRAWCIFRLGEIALARSDHDTARARFQEALPLFLKVGDMRGQARCIERLGDIAFARSEHDTARARFQDALPLYLEVGDLLGQANCIAHIGDIALERSEHDTARVRFQEALPLFFEVGDVLGQANCTVSLGEIALRLSEHDTAHARFQEALPLYLKVGHVLGQANCIQCLGDIALERSEHDTARARFQEALPLFLRIGDVLGQANCIQCLGDIALRQSDRDSARSQFLQALELYTRLPEPYSIGWAHVRLARISSTDSDRLEHVRQARASWTSIGRNDLLQKLRAEFGDHE